MNRRPLSLVVCLLVPFVILVVGLGSAGWQAYHSFREVIREAGRGVVPPGFSVEITESGKHTVWLHTYTIFEGQSYESGGHLPPGAKLVLTDESSGPAIALNSFLSATKSFGSETAVSVGTFETRAPTRVRVMATGIQSPVVLSIAPEKMREVFGAFLKVGGTVILTLFLAIVSLIVLLHRRQKMMRAEEQMHQG